MPELVGLGVRSPDIGGKLSQLLSIQAQKQALAGQAAEVAGAQQTQQQRAALANYMRTKLPQYTLEDGTLDLPAVSADPELLAAAGDKAPEILQGLASVKQFQIDAKKGLWDLKETQRKGVAEVAGGLLSDPDITVQPDDPKYGEKIERGKQKLNQALEQYFEVHGKDSLPAIATYKRAMDNAGAGGLPQVLRTMQLGALSTPQQIAAQQPQLASTGDALKNTNKLATADSAQMLPINIPPGTELVQDANGRIFARNTQTNAVTPLGEPTGPRGSGKGSGGTPSDPLKFTQAVPQQKELETHISEVRKADSDYGQNQHVNDELLRLSADTATGPGSAVWHTGALGKITGTFGGNAGADYQKISAYLDRQAAMSAQQMGLPETNAGLATAANLSGTTEYTPEALQTKVKLSSAMVEGAHQYRKGLDKVVGTGPNQDLTKLQEFRAQWADNFDPNVFRVENALRRNDGHELEEIKSEVGSRGMAELKRKSENLRKLESGELLK